MKRRALTGSPSPNPRWLTTAVYQWRSASGFGTGASKSKTYVCTLSSRALSVPILAFSRTGPILVHVSGTWSATRSSWVGPVGAGGAAAGAPVAAAVAEAAPAPDAGGTVSSFVVDGESRSGGTSSG